MALAAGQDDDGFDPLDAMVGHRVNNVRLIKVLALGTFGAVYLAERNGDRARYAVKCLFKAGLRPEHLAVQHAEIAMHDRVGHHANVVTLESTLETDAHLFLVFEYAARGDLFDLIKLEPTGVYDKQFAWKLFQEIARGVQWCHSRGVFHRDLKPENVLLADDWTAKVADFGLATTAPRPRDFGCGSPPYMAPEVVDRASESYDAAAADVWSLGIIAFNMLFGVNPWERAGRLDRHFRAYAAAPDTCLVERFEMAPSVAALFRAILEPDPARRIGLAELLARAAELDVTELYPAPRRYSSSPAVSIKAHANPLRSRPLVPGSSAALAAAAAAAPPANRRTPTPTALAVPGTAGHSPYGALDGTTASSVPVVVHAGGFAMSGGLGMRAGSIGSGAHAASPAKSHTSAGGSPRSVVVGSWADDAESMDFSAPVVFKDASPPNTVVTSSPGPTSAISTARAMPGRRPPQVHDSPPLVAKTGRGGDDRAESPDIFAFEMGQSAVHDDAAVAPAKTLAGGWGGRVTPSDGVARVIAGLGASRLSATPPGLPPALSPSPRRSGSVSDGSSGMSAPSSHSAGKTGSAGAAVRVPAVVVSTQ